MARKGLWKQVDKENAVKAKDVQKVGEFLSKAESGAVAAGMTSAQKEQQREFLMQQKMKYANAAQRASANFTNTQGPGMLSAVQDMNQVKENLSRLALQQKAIGANQQQYLDDFQNGRISKANYINGKDGGLADIYAGEAEMKIDEFGNINYKVDGKFQPYTNLADYSLKSIDTANSILGSIDKIADSKNPLNKAQMGLFINNMRGMIEQADTSDLYSLIKDNLLPGLENIEFDESLFEPENIGELKEKFLEVISIAAEEVNSTVTGGNNGTRSGGGGGGRGRSGGSSGGGNTTNSGGTYEGFDKNPPKDIEIAQNVWNSNTEMYTKDIEAIRALPNEDRTRAIAELKLKYESMDGQLIEFYGSNDSKSKSGKGRQSNYYIRPNVGIRSDGQPEVGMVFKKGTKGEWKSISPEDFEKEIRGTQGVQEAPPPATTSSTPTGETPEEATEWTPEAKSTNKFMNVDVKRLNRIKIQGSAGANRANILRDGKAITAKNGKITVTGVRAQGKNIMVDAKMFGIKDSRSLGKFVPSNGGFKFSPSSDYKQLKKDKEAKRDFDNFVKAVESDPAFAQEVLKSVSGTSDFSPKDY